MTAAGSAPEPRRRDVVVLGGSAGAIPALRRLVAMLPSDLPATVLVALHRAPVAHASIGAILDNSGPLPAREAEDGDVLEPGRILVAPADRHLLLEDAHVRVLHGPRESRQRPSVDVLFRSAAAACTSRVVAVLLTGLLDDGTSGLWAVKRCGGVAIVQDPADAEYPDMPVSALRHVEVDQVTILDDLVPLLVELTRSEAPPAPEVPAEIRAEVRAALGSRAAGDGDLFGELVELTCPDCGGPLRRRADGSVNHFHCEVGHSFSEDSLLAGQTEQIERSLWVALRSLEDHVRMLDAMASEARRQGRTRSAVESATRASEAREHAQRVRKLLSAGG